MAARDPGAGDDTVADPEGRLLAASDDASDELVTEDDPRPTENRTVIPFRSVRSADRSAENLEHDVVADWSDWIGDALDPNVARPVEDSRFHLSTGSEP